MQLSITSAKLLLFQKQRIVHQCQCIEDIKLELLGENESVVYERVETFFQVGAGDFGRESGLGGVVEEVGGADVGVFFVVYDGGFEAVEGEEIGYFFGRWVLGGNVSWV